MALAHHLSQRQVHVPDLLLQHVPPGSLLGLHTTDLFHALRHHLGVMLAVAQQVTCKARVQGSGFGYHAGCGAAGQLLAHRAHEHAQTRMHALPPSRHACTQTRMHTSTST